jgi:glycosyltransferase involved in cell wall biosynthesis
VKVVIVHCFYEPDFLGGGERVVQTLAGGLVAAGHEVVVVSTAASGNTSSAYVRGVKVYYVGIRNVYWHLNDQTKRPALKPLWHLIDTYNLIMAHEVGRILDIEKPALVHTHGLDGFSVAVWGQIKSRGLACVHTTHTYYLLCPRASMYRDGANCRGWCWDCRLYGMPRRGPSAVVDAAIGVSQFVLQRHLDFGFFGRARVRRAIHNSHSVTDVLSTGESAPSPKLRIGYLGRLHPTKGIELLIQAAASFDGECELRIGGTGSSSYEQQLRKQAAGIDARFEGFVDSGQFLADLDVLVVPSLWNEPFGLVVAEAFAQGVPVIGSMRGAIPELIEDGVTGFLFEPGRPESLDAAIGRFVSDRGLAQKMRAKVLAKSHDFLPQRMVNDYLEVYREVLEGVWV